MLTNSCLAAWLLASDDRSLGGCVWLALWACLHVVHGSAASLLLLLLSCCCNAGPCQVRCSAGTPAPPTVISYCFGVHVCAAGSLCGRARAGLFLAMAHLCQEKLLQVRWAHAPFRSPRAIPNNHLQCLHGCDRSLLILWPLATPALSALVCFCLLLYAQTCKVKALCDCWEIAAMIWSTCPT